MTRQNENGWSKTIIMYILAILVAIGGWFCVNVYAKNEEQDKAIHKTEISVALLLQLGAKVDKMSNKIDNLEAEIKRRRF